MSAAEAVTRQTLRDARTRTAAYGYLFAAISFVQPFAYRHSYSTVAERMAFARSFADNKAVRLLYGEPFDLLSAGGYAAWRVGGSLAIFAAIFGLLAATRALRGEEESGRLDLVLSGIVGRRGAYLAAIAGVAATAAILWLASFAGLLLARLNAGGAAYLALAIVSVGAVFVGVGALASQVAPTRRQATGLATAALAAWFVLRVIGDTSSGAGWLRWTTPFGWAEECTRSPARDRSSCSCRSPRPRCCSLRRGSSRYAVTSAPACCRHTTRRPRGCACSPRRSPRPSATSAGRSSRGRWAPAHCR
jgi:ABC-2 type transport system permease protein